MKILNGKAIAEKIKEELRQEVADLKTKPGLAAILIGSDESSRVYVSRKEKACEQVGIKFYRHELPEDVKSPRVERLVKKLNKDPKIHGILVQLPLPTQLDTDTIIEQVEPQKDADGFHPTNRHLLKEGKPRVIPPTQAGVLRLLEETQQDFAGKQVVLLANSLAFIEPLKNLLQQHGMESQSLLSHEGYQRHTLQADVLVVAVGIPKLIKAADIKKGATVIDVGINRINGRTIGDVDADSVKSKAAYLSPVPGGVGPLTVAYLLKNVIELAKQS